MKPLGETQRRLLIVAELYRRRRGESPLWRELATLLELEEDELASRLRVLKRQALVTYSFETRSLRVTERGLALALNGRKAAARS